MPISPKTLFRAVLFVCLSMLFWTSLSASPSADDDNALYGAAPANIDQALNLSELQNATETIIHVNPSHPSSSDTNTGTEALPVKSLTRGVELAINVNKTNTPVKVLIYPGTYRTQIGIFANYGYTNAAMTFEAQQPGTAVITGSSHWTGWEPVEGTSFYSKAWTWNWGFAPIPPGWPAGVPDIARRRELVYIDGVRQIQVLNYAELAPGKFFVDEVGDKIYIAPTSAAPIENQFVEVGTRQFIFNIVGRQNITLRGLVFQHDTTPLDTGIRISESQNVLIENNIFRENNWGGFGLFTVRNAVTRGNTYIDNGGYGFNAWRLNTFLSENDQSSGNNWRGTLDPNNQKVGWSLAGIKHLNVHNATYRNYRATNNKTYGLWLDTDMTNIVVENSYLCNNRDLGIYLESIRGPITVRNNVICGHLSGAGLLTANVQNFTFTGNILYNNKNGIKVSGPTAGRTETDWETGQIFTIPNGSSWNLYENIFMVKYSSHYVFNTTVTAGTPWTNFLNGLTSNNNVWFNSQGSKIFRLDNGKTYTLSEWRQLTGKDSTSVQGNPFFRNPDASDFVQLESTATATGTGLRAEYFNEMNLTSLAVTRNEALVNFNWGLGSPDALVQPDTFSARWSGQIQPRFTQMYTFHSVNDDGMRLWVNNVLVINDWDRHLTLDNYGKILLVGGQRYNIRVEWFDNLRGAQMRLFWSSPSHPEELIPTNRLYPATTSMQNMVELIPNRSFEDVTETVTADSTRFFADWKGVGLSLEDRVVCNNEKKTTVAWSGECAFQFYVQPNHSANLIYKPALASPLKADVLTLSAFVQTQSLVGDPHLRMTVKYTDGRKERLKVSVADVTGKYSFIHNSLPLSGVVKSIKVEVRYKNNSAETGYFWVDVISLLAGNLSDHDTAEITTEGLVPLPQAESSLGNSSTGERNLPTIDLPSSLDSRGQP